MHIRKNKKHLVLTALVGLLAGTVSSTANAMSLDWSGSFRADHSFIQNYQMDKSAPGNSRASGLGGEYIPGEGEKSTVFTTMFFRLKPRVLVNDNVIIRSEWNIGDPVSGFFGRSVPTNDRNDALSTRKDALGISASRLWMDAHTEFGTLQVGRAPMDWGLGIIFNAGDGAFDRYQSTSDTIRVHTKFGNLSLMPLYAKNSTGRNAAGSSNPISGATLNGSDDVTDYGLALKYESTEDELEAGGLYYKRNASDTQTTYYYPSTTSTYVNGANGMNIRLFDFYARKTWGHFTIGAELPIFQGDIGDVNGVGSRNEFRATALAFESALKFDTWNHYLKLGTAPGQESRTTGARGKQFGAMSFHRAYKLGQILFGYNLGNFGAANPDADPSASTGTAPSNSVSPFDASITNARYLMLASEKKWEQWSLSLGFVYALANQTATVGKDAYQHRTRQWYTSVANTDQSNKLGWELDFGTGFKWDENISFGSSLGLFFPGDYYAFANGSAANSGNFSVRTSRVTAFSLFTSASF